MAMARSLASSVGLKGVCGLEFLLRPMREVTSLLTGNTSGLMGSGSSFRDCSKVISASSFVSCLAEAWEETQGRA